MKKEIRKRKSKVIVAMSGGLDSSVAAALLKRAGFVLKGVFMKLYPDYLNVSEKRARKVACILKIPFYVLNFEKEFKKRVVDYFLREYQRGRTPNPCIVCNKEIKFGLLLEKALRLKGDFVATGHYACLRREISNPLNPKGTPRRVASQTPKYKLMRAKDKEKDQSYFLWQLSQKQLKHILFPMGDYTKKQARVLAKKYGLPVLNIPESQEICFVRTTVNNFLSQYLKSKPGPIVEQARKGAGKIIGQHQGLHFYTIGQRKGIELPGGPFYVVKKDFKRNALMVTPFSNDKALFSKSLTAEKLNWLSGKAPKLPLKVRICSLRSQNLDFGKVRNYIPKVKAQIRYGHKAVSATITKKLKSGKIELEFGRAQRAITPGQSVVFYLPAGASVRAGKGQEVLGGGIIC